MGLGFSSVVKCLPIKYRPLLTSSVPNTKKERKERKKEGGKRKKGIEGGRKTKKIY
jgi:hypothetical protein